MGETAGQVMVGPGWSELARGDWTGAHTYFERALEQHESAAAFEGLMAAWWFG